MQITGLSIQNYGVCKNQSFEDIQSAMLVVFGPNEAGKTTTMQFIRGLFFGLNSPERRSYTTGTGGKYGGSLKAVDSEGNQWHITRMMDAEEDTSIVINGQIFPASALGRDLLSGIDPELFEHVFTVGLAELQHLNQLNATDAAEFLYEMTSGFDRKSVGNTLRHITNQREQLLADCGSGKLQALHGQLNSISKQLDDRKAEMQPWVANSNEIQIINQQINALQAELVERQTLLNDLGIYGSLETKLLERGRLRTVLAQSQPPKIHRAHTRIDERLALLELAIRGHETLSSIDERESELLILEEELRAINTMLLPPDVAPRMNAFAEMLPWISSLLSEVELLAAEPLNASDSHGIPDIQTGIKNSTNINKKLLLTLRQPARKLKESRKRLKENERVCAELQQSIAQAETAWINSPAWRSLSITPSLEHPSIELRQKLTTLIGDRKQLATAVKSTQQAASQSPIHLDTPAPLESPASLLLNAILICVGGTLLGMGLFFPDSFGLSNMAIVVCILSGLLSITGGVYGTIVQSRNRSHAVYRNRRREELTRLRQQMERKADEAADSNSESTCAFPDLDELEAAIAGTESLLDMAHELERLRLNLKVTQRKNKDELSRHQDALSDWQGSLRLHGLPEELSPIDLYALVENADRIAEQHRIKSNRAADLQRKQSELRELDLRMTALLDDAGMPSSHLTVSSRAEHIAQVARNQKELQRELLEVESNISATVKTIAVLASESDNCTRQLSRIYATLGISSLWEYAELTDRLDEYEVNRDQLSELEHSISASLSHHSMTLTDLEPFEGLNSEDVHERSCLLQEEINSINGDLQHAFELRGQLKAKSTQITSDRDVNQLRLQKRNLELRIQAFEEHWQIWTLTEHLFGGVREHFESQRQPETLRNASLWLDTITEGDYCRIWTPLGEDLLYVDDAQGQPWAIDSLSRGTRESIYLSLRFALVRSYHEEGISLPLILDDVLVNCDLSRAKNAIKAIHQFSNEVGQVLFFTCHDHIAELFSQVGADVRPIIKPDTVTAPGIPRISFDAVTAHEAVSSDTPAPVPFTSPSDSDQPSFEELHNAITETDDLITTLGADEYGDEIEIIVVAEDEEVEEGIDDELLEVGDEIDADEYEDWEDEQTDDEIAA